MGRSLMPFGKYQGDDIEEIAERDPDYLRWVADQWWCHGWLEAEIRWALFAAPPEEDPVLVEDVS
jgi:uncharacterized protein (DUF3820 family)